jgi:hypothetical protein
VEESETTPVGERKTMRQGGDLGEMVGAMRREVVPPLYTMGRFGHVPWTRATPRPWSVACAHVYEYHCTVSIRNHYTGSSRAAWERPHSSELTVKGIDPTATSVVTCSEGFGQGSGEN